MKNGEEAGFVTVKSFGLAAAAEKFFQDVLKMPAGILQMFPAMGRAKILIGAEGNDTRGVNVIVSDVVMPFDVIHIHGVRHVIVLIEIFEIAKQIGIIHNAPDIAFKMAVIHRVKSDERHEQPPVCLHGALAKKISSCG